MAVNCCSQHPHRKLKKSLKTTFALFDRPSGEKVVHFRMSCTGVAKDRKVNRHCMHDLRTLYT
jgi:hypothetical protein